MPYATNPNDQVRSYFEDSGDGGGQPVLVYPGFTDPLEYAKASPIVRALKDDFRLVLADHRGQGRSDKPHDVASYALTTRVADAIAILDVLGVERAHYIGFSWGARLGFAIGEHAPERVWSLVLCGNQPYEWPVNGPMMRAVADAVAVGREHGMVAFIETWESSLIGERLPEPSRTWMLQNDPVALDAEIRSAFVEGPISRDLTKWNHASSTQAKRTRCTRTPRGQRRLCPAPPSFPSPATHTSQRSTWQIIYFQRFLSCSARLDPDLAERLQLP